MSTPSPSASLLNRPRRLFSTACSHAQSLWSIAPNGWNTDSPRETPVVLQCFPGFHSSFAAGDRSHWSAPGVIGCRDCEAIPKQISGKTLGLSPSAPSHKARSSGEGPIAMHENDVELASAALAGDEQALKSISARLPMLTRILSVSMAPSLAEEIAGDVISDCFGGRKKTRGSGSDRILEKYRGQCSLDAWLTLVARNRFKDRLRGGEQRLGVSMTQDGVERDFADPNSAPEPMTADVEALVADALRHAFSSAPAIHIVILRLVHLHGISQREVARVWKWSEAKVSRLLDDAGEALEENTIAQLKRQDPGLDLRWEDCLAICGQHPEILREE
jgi:RNA polymerase sigma factor (sigma-70 family)